MIVTIVVDMTASGLRSFRVHIAHESDQLTISSDDSSKVEEVGALLGVAGLIGSVSSEAGQKWLAANATEDESKVFDPQQFGASARASQIVDNDLCAGLRELLDSRGVTVQRILLATL